MIKSKWPAILVIFIVTVTCSVDGTATLNSAQANQTFVNSIGMKFVLIPSGTFTMGSPVDEPGRRWDERQHRVTLSKPLYLQATEVTQAQWMDIMGNNPSRSTLCDDCPVEYVSWNECQEFIRRLNKREHTSKYRLPTESEWEYACRVGTTTAFANGGITNVKCGFDPNLDTIGWYCGNTGYKGTHPVAQKNSNAWGLYDMHGNVWEWCQDWYGAYPNGSVTDPQGPSSGPGRIIRGGGWNGWARNLRSAERRYDYSPAPTNYLGFRLMRTP